MGTAGQIGLGFTGLNFAADIRDLIYDFSHWEWSGKHILQTVLDAVGLIPGIGVIKNLDEVAYLVKTAIQSSDVIVPVVKKALYNVDTVIPALKQTLNNMEIDFPQLVSSSKQTVANLMKHGDEIKEGITDASKGIGKIESPKLVPPTKEIREKFDNEGLTQDRIDEIVSLPKSKKQKPETYLSNQYIEEHLSSFKESGVVKIIPFEPTGTIGGKGGTFVMSRDQLDEIIKLYNGDISKIEDALGFDRGYLGKNPFIAEIHKFSGLRIPQGNEIGALREYWLPGGYTIKGIKEAVIDPAPIGTYTYRSLF